MTHALNNFSSQYHKPPVKRGKNRSVQLYRAARSHYKNGSWKAALTAVDELMKTYPNISELHNLHSDLLERISEQEARSSKRNPLYRAAVRHIKNGELTPGKALVDRLVSQYPQDNALRDLKKELFDRIRRKKEIQVRRRLIIALACLLLLFVSVSGLFWRYVRSPAPLAELISPNVNMKYEPHYLFSIYGTDKPMGIGISPGGDRIYVTEMGGSRLVRIFDRKGNPKGAIELPHTNIGERAPVYLATDNDGRVYVSDRKQHAVYIFNPDGEYLETLVGPDLTLSEYVANHTQGQLTGEKYVFNIFQNALYYQDVNGMEQSVSLPIFPEWSPLGIRINQEGTLFLTDVEKDKNSVHILTLSQENAGSLSSSLVNPAAVMGTTGDGDGELLFPNSAVADSKGRIFVADGNNGRISVWDRQGNFLFSFGKGTGDGALSLPRGMFVDRHDRLFVVDAVGQNIKVYDISSEVPEFLYDFGDFGLDDGLFNFPNDIAVDFSGRLYIADRENNRIQVWSY